MTLPSNIQQYCVIIPAAGIGSRFADSVPKQYAKLAEKTILEHTIHCFLSCDFVKKIVVALHPQDQYWPSLNMTDTRIVTVIGGQTRAQSVLHGLIHLNQIEAADQWVMVHDACRPYVTHDAIIRLINTVRDDDVGGLLAIPSTDTLKQVHAGRVIKTVPRDCIWQAQTPQLFRLDVLYQAINSALTTGHVITDEASAIELIGLSPMVVEGDVRNIKITYITDLA